MVKMTNPTNFCYFFIMENNSTQNQDFTAGYTPRKRILEYCSILSFAALFFIGTTQVSAYSEVLEPMGFLLCTIGAFLFADFASGVVHWAADTWGSVQWPLIGQTLIRSFREHHVDEKAITRHDFVETNGDNCMICLPILLTLALAEPEQTHTAALHFVFLNVVVWVLLTNQIHKWAHADELPKWVRILHRSKLILSPEHHNQHHKHPFVSHYCITSGWMNPFLNQLGFFRAAERAVSGLTGARPRVEDLANAEK